MADAAPILETLAPALVAPTAGVLTPTPYSFEFTGEDRLKLSVANSVTGVRVSVNYRVKMRDGRVQANVDTFVPSSDRVVTTHEIEIGTGYLMNVSAFASAGAPVIGQTFVKLQVIRGSGAAAIVLGTLLQDYVTASQDVAWPGSPIRTSTDGEPPVRRISGTTPAVGGEVSETVPQGARWELLTLAYQYVTSGVAVTRRSRVSLRDNVGAEFAALLPATTQGASDNLPYKWAPNLPAIAIASTGMQQAIPQRAILMSGWVWGTSTQGIDAGDHYAAVIYTVREWLEVA